MNIRIQLIVTMCLVLANLGECFVRRVQLPYITNGQQAGRNQFPHQAAVFMDSGWMTGFCGGSLISDEWVLTAAHCVEGMVKFTIVLGAHRLPYKNESGRQVFLVEAADAHPHPDWSRFTLLNDISLLRLPTKAKLDENVQVIELTSGGASLEASGTLTTVSGWGKVKDDLQSTAEYLQYAEQPVISNGKCAMFYFSVIKPSHICTSGRNGISTCQGDSGGPLVVVDGSGVPRQIGIVSFGVSLGCEIGWPPVFTRISQHLDYIKEVTGIVPA